MALSVIWEGHAQLVQGSSSPSVCTDLCIGYCLLLLHKWVVHAFSLITNLLPQTDAVKEVFQSVGPSLAIHVSHIHPRFSGRNSSAELFEEAGKAYVMIPPECFCFSGEFPVLLCMHDSWAITGFLCTGSNIPLCLTSPYMWGFVRGSWGWSRKNVTTRGSHTQQAL